MTGKEALNNLIEELKWCCNDGKELRAYDKKMIEPIQRDLEMLEILKNKIEVLDNTTYTANPKYYIQLRQDVILNEETLKFIKEWLDKCDIN